MGRGGSGKRMPESVRRRLEELATERAKPAIAKRQSLGLERALQSRCEKWLEYCGYWRRTPVNIECGPPPRGWYLHLVQAQGNPIALDLVILAEGADGATAWLEVELKTATGRATICQGQLLAQQPTSRRLVRSVDELRDVVAEWENRRGC